MGKHEWAAPGNPWESQAWLGLRLLPQMPHVEGLQAHASGICSPPEWRLEAHSGSCQKLRESIAGLDAAQLLHTSYLGALCEGNLFPTSQCPHPHGSVIPQPLTPNHSHLSPPISAQCFSQTWLYLH